MNDRAPIRDRTLILRVLVPGLEARLRDKMKELEDQQQQQQQQSRGGGGTNDSNSAAAPNNYNNGGGGGASGANKESYLDLDGVTCEPTPARNRTLWNFHCDGATYPARLVNLPCPIELHKTHDHAMYYKCVDVCQMLIVYEDDMALEEAEFVAVEGFPSYYHSGITPPLRKVVERRFAAREHRAMAPPRAAIVDVESELTDLMENLAKDEKNKRKSKVPTLSSATKVLVRALDRT
jgi:transcription initiation factor TFIID subunit 7